MSKEKQCECCHEWWYDSDVKENLCPNCYDYFKQLKQQLEEKDQQIKKRVIVYEKQFIVPTNEIYSLKQQLAEKQKTIDEINKEFVQAIHDWKTLCAEKDKEIEDWKQKTQTFLNRVNEQNYEIANNNPKQLAIQELEKVKTLIQNAINFETNFVGVYDAINKQINDLRGENNGR